MWGSTGGLSTLFKNATCCILWSQPTSHATFPAVASLFLTPTHSGGDVNSSPPKVLEHVVHFISRFCPPRNEFDFVYRIGIKDPFSKSLLLIPAYASPLLKESVIHFLDNIPTTWSCKFRQRKATISFVEVLGFWHWQSARGTSQESRFFVGNVFSASPGRPRRKDTKNIQ